MLHPKQVQAVFTAFCTSQPAYLLAALLDEENPFSMWPSFAALAIGFTPLLAHRL